MARGSWLKAHGWGEATPGPELESALSYEPRTMSHVIWAAILPHSGMHSFGLCVEQLILLLFWLGLTKFLLMNVDFSSWYSFRILSSHCFGRVFCCFGLVFVLEMCGS